MKTNKKKVLKKIEPIFHKVFENKKIKLKFTSSSKNISRWDSLAQINLVVNIEKLFKIRFNVSGSTLTADLNSDEWNHILITKTDIVSPLVYF